MENLVEKIPLQKIILEPEKYRHFDLDENGIEKLLEDIKEKGLLVPILIWRKGEEDILISGYHRFECGKRLKWGSIPARIMFFESDYHAIEASVQTNAQDQYTFSRRSWFKRFSVAEDVLREIYEKRARRRQISGKKVQEKKRVDELLARGVGLTWSYAKYGQMRKIYNIINDDEIKIQTEVVDCLELNQDPKIQLWLEVFEMKKQESLDGKDWDNFVDVCAEASKQKDIESISRINTHLKYLRKKAPEKNDSIKKETSNGNLLITWKNPEEEYIIEEIKKLCRENNWHVKVEQKTTKEMNVFSQKISFSIPLKNKNSI